MEIERKFMLDKFPNIEYIKEVEIYQGYLSVNPEVRILSYQCNDYIDYRITVKSDGGLSREEIEICIDESSFIKMKKIIDKPLIKKIYRKYKLSEGLILECSNVDIEEDSEFMYAEIEFENEEQALNFTPPVYLGKEVTYDPTYKMKNYWERTRN